MMCAFNLSNSASYSKTQSVLLPDFERTKASKKAKKPTVLTASTEDSFQSVRKVTPQQNTHPVKPTEKGISLVGTALITLASLGVGAGAILTARHLNWFELGQKTETTVVEKIPTAIADALGVAKEATQDQITKKIKGLQATVTKLEAEAKAKPQDTDLQAKLQNATDKLAVANHDLATETQAHGATVKEVVAKETTIADLNNQLGDKNTIITDLEGQIKTKQDEIEGLSKQVTDKNTEISTEQKNLDIAKQELAKTEQALQASLLVQNAKEAKVAQLTTELAEATQRFTELNQAENKALADKKIAEENLQRSVEGLQRAKVTFEKQNERIKQQQLELTKAQQSLDNYSTQIQTLTGENALLTNTVNQLKADLTPSQLHLITSEEVSLPKVTASPAMPSSASTNPTNQQYIAEIDKLKQELEQTQKFFNLYTTFQEYEVWQQAFKHSGTEKNYDRLMQMDRYLPLVISEYADLDEVLTEDAIADFMENLDRTQLKKIKNSLSKKCHPDLFGCVPDKSEQLTVMLKKFNGAIEALENYLEKEIG